MLVGVAVVLWLAAALIALGATEFVRRWALARGFLDRPGAHRAHARPVPLGGGVGILAGILVPLVTGAAFAAVYAESPPAWLPAEFAAHLVGAASRAGQIACIVAGALVLAVVGLIDDRRPLSAGLRLGVHFGVAALVYAGGVRITAFVDVPGASLVLTLLWIAGLTNAFNFLDNADGLASGVAVIIALLLAIALASPEPQLFVIALLLVIAGAAFGFWLHNRPPATIFMGDAGSTNLGYLLGVATALATFYGDNGRTHAQALLVPLLAMALPLYDTTSVVCLRLARGVSPFTADRNHFSHRLLRLGLGRWQMLGTIYTVTLATGLGALVVDRADPAGAWLLGIQGIALLAVIAILEAAAAAKPPAPGNDHVAQVP